MRLLTLKKKHLFVDKLIKLRQQLNGFKPENTLQSLGLFENQLTLNEMEACFFDSKPDEINAHLMSFLSSRWERICNSNMCYTQQPGNLVNQLCFEIAKEIASPASTTSEIEALEPRACGQFASLSRNEHRSTKNQRVTTKIVELSTGPNIGPYCLLMPSLENSEDVYGNNIHTLGLHEFVLSDNARAFIPLAQCLHQASVSDMGRLRHIVAIDGGYPELTSTEIERVSQHSTQASKLYQAVIAFNKQRLFGDDISAKLRQLANALRAGGLHGFGSGSDFNAGFEANEGILVFFEYWEALSEELKLAIFTEEPGLKNVLGRLFRPNDADYTDTLFCVESLAVALDCIIERYNKKSIIRICYNLALKEFRSFEKASKSRHGLAIIPKEIPPKHILHRIFKLNIDEQKVLFKQQGYANALMYALAHEPEALTEFELDEASKQHAATVNNGAALIVAAKSGKTDAVKLLLNWGALNKNLALNWAVCNGHADTVACLLEHGALLDDIDSCGYTALFYAVECGRTAVVELLLEKGANVRIINNQGNNALDIAIVQHPECVDAILMHLATLPVEEQEECLLNVPGGPYPNVLFYAAAHKPENLRKLLALKESNTSTADITGILAQMHFDEHMKYLYTHYERMRKKSFSNSNYIDAASAAKTLLIELGKAKVALCQSDAVADIKILSFKNTCKSAIERATPVLEKHREWGKVLAAFLLAIITFPVSLPLYAVGFFSVKTKSNQLLDKLYKAIDKPSFRGGELLTEKSSPFYSMEPTVSE